MDSVTQALLGAACGEMILGKDAGGKALLLGAFVGTLPDLDVLLLPFFDDVQRISVHRGYSHSIPVLIILTLVLSSLTRRIQKSWGVGQFRWTLFFLVALVTHVILDSFTSYGTQLFQPFSDIRVSFDSITIVDPLYTLPLLIGIAITFFRRRKKVSNPSLANFIGVILSTTYLLGTLLNHNRVENLIHDSFVSQNINVVKLSAVPVSFGGLLWYGVGKTEDGLYLGDYSIFDGDRPIEFRYYPTNDKLVESFERQDVLEKLRWFANDFYVIDQQDDKFLFYNLKCDMTGPDDKSGAPTSFYYEFYLDQGGQLVLTPKMHDKIESVSNSWGAKLDRIFQFAGD